MSAKSEITPLVSIICPAYNHENYIAQALDGFVMQKTNFPIEIIVHDDASTDGTERIIREYEAKYPHLFRNIYQTENQFSKEMMSVTKILLKVARGNYIAGCEGDDYWTDPYKLQKQVDFLERNENFSACFHNAWIDNTIQSRMYKYHKWENSREITAGEVIEIGGYVYPTASLVFRNVLEKDALANDDCLAGDLVLSLELLLKGKFYFFNEFMCVYRRHEGGFYSGVLKNKQRMTEIEISVISFLEKIRIKFPNDYQKHFDTALKGKYSKLYLQLDFPISSLFRNSKYFSLIDLFRIIKYRITNVR
jgi:glycosyltransferase involved in cell wall biosynthesis